MIHTLRYEPRGQRQRFKSQGQQRVERGEQDRHIHLHFHLDLTFRGKHRRSLHSNAIHMTRIFAALVAATAIYLTSLSLGHSGSVPMPPTPFLGLADPTLRLGLLIAWVATWLGGLPFLISAWLREPRVAFFWHSRFSQSCSQSSSCSLVWGVFLACFSLSVGFLWRSYACSMCIPSSARSCLLVPFAWQLSMTHGLASPIGSVSWWSAVCS